MLENSSVVGTGTYPVVIGQRTIFGHRCQVIGARIGNLREIGERPDASVDAPGAAMGTES